jgi:transcriptional regulator with XRE-family HTH domain
MSQLDHRSTGVIPPLTQGWRLQMALAHANMSVEQMSQELGVSRSTISRWLNDRGTPSRGYLRLWSELTDVDLDWLSEAERGLISVQTSRPAGIPTQPVATAGHTPVDNDITRRMRKRIPLNPALALVLRIAS